jgi:hypothetical protein
MASKTPIMEFKTIEEAKECLNEWKDRLCLHGWTIKIKLSEPHEFKNENCDGECEYTLTVASALIRILKPEYYGDRLLKYCAERILVHELLNCAWGHLDTGDKGFNRLQHSIMEQTARALICAKYDLPINWFDNIKYD